MGVAIPADQMPLEPKGPNAGRWKIYWFNFLQTLANYPAVYTVAGLPVSSTAGSIAYASNGRKPGEGSGSGSGVLVYYDSTGAWISVHSAVAVTA
jgi:hypothetical protein